MIKETIKSAKLAVSLALAVTSATSSAALAQSPFHVDLLNDSLANYSPVAAVHSAAGAETIHAGTLGGPVTNIALYPPEGLAGGSLADRSDPLLATLAFGGVGHEIIAGGLGRLPVISVRPGANAGIVTTPGKVMGVYSHAASRRVAVLLEDRVRVYEDVPEGAAPTDLMGRFRFVTWVRDTPTSGPESIWLAAVDAGAGSIRVWKAGAWNTSHEVGLPPAPGSGTGWTPLDLTCAPIFTDGGVLVTGDAGGRLRAWRVERDATRKPLPATADASTFSSDASALVEHQGARVIFRTPFANTSEIPIASKGDSPSALRVLKAGMSGLAAAAWPVSAGGVTVDLFDFDKSTRSQLFPSAPPASDVTAMAFRPADNATPAQAAGSPGGKGVVFFENPAPTPPPAPAPTDPKEDTGVVGLFYRPEAKGQLLAIGSAASLYDPATRTLVAAPSPFALTDASDRVTACDVARDPGDPAGQVRVLLGTAKGRLELWQASLDAAPIAITQLAASEASGKPIRAVSLRDGVALTSSDLGTVLWSVGTSSASSPPIVAVESVNPTKPSRAVALAPNGAAAFRDDSGAALVSPSAFRVVRCGTVGLTHVVYDNAAHFIAVDATGLHYTTGTSNSAPANPVADPSPVPLTAMNISADGQTLLEGLTTGGKGVVRRRAIAAGVPQAPEDFQLPNPVVSAILFGANATTAYVGHGDGRLVRLAAVTPTGSASPPTRLVQDLRLADASGGVTGLAWRPEAGSGEPELLLVAERSGTLSLRRPAAGAAPKLTLPDGTADYPAPWYAAALPPGGGPIALVNAEGQVWAADWDYPPRLNGLAPPAPGDLTLRPAVGAGHPAGKRPLYAIAWSKKAGTDAIPVVGGAEGTVYVGRSGAWSPPPPSTPRRRPVYALATQPTSGALAVGLGPNSGVNDEAWLSVRTDPSDPSTAKPWPGHTSAVRALAFSPDGMILASVERNGGLTLWDATRLATGDAKVPPSTTLQLSSAVPTSLEWVAPDALAVGLESGSVRIYRITK